MRTPYTDEMHLASGRIRNRSDRPTFAIVDLGALAHNFRIVKQRAAHRKILAVVKAQAYGHGAVRVSQHLLGQGAAVLGVALVEEARELREAGIKSPILVMGAIFPEQAEEIVRLEITAAAFTEPVVIALSKAAHHLNKDALVHLKVDTGMGRIGIVPERVPEFIQRMRTLGRIRIDGIMTHFADADLQDKQFAAVQMDRFETLHQLLVKQGIVIPDYHAANSAAVLDFDRALFSMVRPGLMLYGYNPLQGNPSGISAELRPVLSLVTRVAFLKKVPPGIPISYGRTFTTNRESLIATIPIGYADGYSRSQSNRGEAIVRGVRVPVVGRVCMDMTMLDVTDVSGIAESDEVILIGSSGHERITADDIAAKAQTISYEVLCGISSRVPRVYV